MAKNTKVFFSVPQKSLPTNRSLWQVLFCFQRKQRESYPKSHMICTQNTYPEFLVSGSSVSYVVNPNTEFGEENPANVRETVHLVGAFTCKCRRTKFSKNTNTVLILCCRVFRFSMPGNIRSHFKASRDVKRTCPVVKFDINKKRRKFLPVLPSFLPPSVKQSSHTHTHTHTHIHTVTSCLLSPALFQLSLLSLSLLSSSLSSHLPMYSPQ